MLEKRKLMKVIRKCSNRIRNRNFVAKSEILTGDMYRDDEVLNSFAKNGDNICLAFSTDGIQPYNESPSSLWPLTCTVNELDVNYKSKFMMMNTLWFGKTKPDFNSYMIPFVTEMVDLYENGVSWKDKNGAEHVTKVLGSICICDSPARCAVGKMAQYNGRNGCTFCLYKGQMARKAGRKKDVVVYPIELPLPDRRTHADTFLLARQAVTSGSPHHGVRGYSILYKLPNFDIIKGFVPDSMHCAWIGIGGQFLNLWFGSAKENYYIGNKIKEIDEMLLAAKATNEILRNPRSLKLRKFFKASEHRNFILFYSPIVLFKSLPPPHYRHWLLFVKSMRLLFQKQISLDQIEIARCLLYLFVDEIPTLYGIENVSYNVHLLLHMVDACQEWGAPWAYSAFLPEDIGGTITHYFHGTNHVEKQIFSHISAANNSYCFSRKHIPLAADNLQELYEKLGFSNTYVKGGPRVTTIGKGTRSVFDADDVIAVDELIGEVLTCTNYIFYKKVIINTHLFSTASYDLPFKRNNSVVFFSEKSGCEVHKFARIALNCNYRFTDDICSLAPQNEDDTKLLFIAQTLKFKQRTQVESNTHGNITSFIKYVDINATRNIIAGEVDKLKLKCVQIPSNGQMCYVVNNLKFEKG